MDTTAFAALAEPNRMKIVDLLRAGHFSVGEIADSLKLRQPQTTKHLQVLLNAGLVKVTPVAQKRVYALAPEPFVAINDWLDGYRQVWEDRMDAMETHAVKVASQRKQHQRTPSDSNSTPRKKSS